MFHIEVSSEFSAAHQLLKYKGRCENLHGHNWKVHAVVASPLLDSTGMAIDFHQLKEYLNKILDALDHKHLNDLAPFRKTNPTSENIAKYIFENLSKHISSKHIKLESISVWETATSRATYTEEKK